MPMMFGTGKAKALNAVEKCPLQLPGQESANITEVITEAKQFVSQCYGMKETSSSKNRFVSPGSLSFSFYEKFDFLVLALVT